MYVCMYVCIYIYIYIYNWSGLVLLSSLYRLKPSWPDPLGAESILGRTKQGGGGSKPAV